MRTIEIKTAEPGMTICLNCQQGDNHERDVVTIDMIRPPHKGNVHFAATKENGDGVLCRMPEHTRVGLLAT